jgi:hypothetical protein
MNRLVDKETVSNQFLAIALRIFLDVERHVGEQRSLRQVVAARVAGAERVLAADPAQMRRLVAVAVDIDVVGACMAPTHDLAALQHVDAVDEADQLARAVGVQQDELVGIVAHGRFPPPAGGEPHRLVHLLTRVVVPIDRVVQARRTLAARHLETCIRGERHGEISRHAALGLDGQKRRIQHVHVLRPLASRVVVRIGIGHQVVHRAEKIGQRRLDVGHRLAIEIDPQHHVAPDIVARDPEAADAAGTFDIGQHGRFFPFEAEVATDPPRHGARGQIQIPLERREPLAYRRLGHRLRRCHPRQDRRQQGTEPRTPHRSPRVRRPLRPAHQCSIPSCRFLPGSAECRTHCSKPLI